MTVLLLVPILAPLLAAVVTAVLGWRRGAAVVTVGAALSQVFTELPHARGYVLDERGQLRKHVCIFADGKRLPREAALGQSIRPDSKLYVMQALSGG